MTENERGILEGATRLNKPVLFKHKGKPGREQWGIVEGEVSIIVGEYKHVIQRIRLNPENWGTNKFAYRGGYYTLKAKTRQLVWGQYSALLLEADFRKLMRKAEKKGWLGSSKHSSKD
jgi:hypothetical protein